MFPLWLNTDPVSLILPLDAVKDSNPPQVEPKNKGRGDFPCVCVIVAPPIPLGLKTSSVAGIVLDLHFDLVGRVLVVTAKAEGDVVANWIVHLCKLNWYGPLGKQE